MTEDLKTSKLQLENPNEAIALFGISDSNLKMLEAEYEVSIVTRGETIDVSGKETNVEKVYHVLFQLLKVIRKGINISGRDVVICHPNGKNRE